MADEKKIAPGGVLDPAEDINFNLNPKFNTPNSVYQPPAGPLDTPDPPDYIPPAGPQDGSEPPDYIPPPGPRDTPDPPDYVPPAGPQSTPNPPTYIPALGPEASPNPPGYIPAEGPNDTPEPPDYIPLNGPQNTPNPPDYVPTGPRVNDIRDFLTHEGVRLNSFSDVLDGDNLTNEQLAAIPRISTPIAPGGLLIEEKDIQKRSHLANEKIMNLINSIDPGGLLGGLSVGIDINSGFPIEIQGRHSPTGGGGPGSKALDPILYAKSLINMGNALGLDGLALFLFENTLLWGLNPNQSVFNPAYLANRAPIINNLVPVGIAPLHTEIVNVAESIRSSIGSISSQASNINHLSEINELTPDNNQTSNPQLSVDEIVDNILDKKSKPYISNSTVQNDMISSTAQGTFNAGPVIRKKFSPLDSLFQKKKLSIGNEGFTPTNLTQAGQRRFKDVSATKLSRASFHEGIIPMEFPNEDDTNAIITSGEQRPQDIIDDDTAYVPLSFTDLRPLPSGEGKYRTIYFRPIITSLTENLSPEWDKKSGFGRTDPVGVYGSTSRTIQLGFELHAFAPEDLEVMYKKLNWLASLVYPEYDSDMIMKSGPVCRMRVGDIISSKGLGVPGFIEGLDFDYTDSIWELKKNSKAPRSIRVSLSFQVLHDTIIGRHTDGGFGGIGYVNGEGEFTTKSSAGIETTTRKLTTELVPTPDGFRTFGKTGKINGKK